MNIPEFNKKYVCIVNNKEPNLAAVISSYLHQDNTFLAVFEFPVSTTAKPTEFTEGIDEHSFSIERSEELNIRIHNAVKQIGGCEYLILGGLTENQKSYLTFLNNYDHIEVNSIDEVESCLGGLAYEKTDYLSVQPEEALIGLFLAAQKGLKLRLETTADIVERSASTGKYSGLIVAEDSKTVSTIAAVNYAISVNADINVVSPFNESDIQKIKFLIEDWQSGNEASHSDLHSMLFRRIDKIDFLQYEYATFFTKGAPFSLTLKNQIPFSYVHLNQYPSLFITSNIFFEKRDLIGSSIVFSPQEFITEETDFVINTFKQKNYWVKKLIGEEASAYNIDFHVKEYPYDIIHICSHGGEVNGYNVIREFLDRNGKKHIIEYDDVLSFYPGGGRESIKIGYIHIWRKFNDFIWKSKELKEQNYPQYVFSDMIEAIIHQEQTEEKYIGIPKEIVPNSCHIKCFDFIYQAMFHVLASLHTSPIIFNNTCWSWDRIANPFIHGGARGYIGTLWKVKNSIAKLVAEDFYSNLSNDTILNSLHKAMNKTKGSESEDIYIYWGLHFSTLKKVDSVEKSRLNIAECLMYSLAKLGNKARELPAGKTKENTHRLAEWNLSELGNNFFVETSKLDTELTQIILNMKRKSNNGK